MAPGAPATHCLLAAKIDRVKPLSPDTPLDVEEVWLSSQRQRGPQWRLQRAVEMTHLCWQAAQEAEKRAHPDASPKERDLRLTTLRYGEELAQELVRLKEKRGFYGTAA